MRQLFSRLLVVALLVLACSGAVWGDNLTVTITKDSVKETKTGQESLERALEGYGRYDVEGIEVSAGDFTEADWIWLKEKRWDLAGLKKFEVTGDIGNVADIPNTTKDKQYFNGSLKELHVAKLKRVGDYALQDRDRLTSVTLPDVTAIGDRAFYGCKNLANLKLGATPPSVGRDAFSGCPLVRNLKLIDADGSPLTGDALANAKSRYRAVEDGETEDNLWYGWAFEDAPSSNLSGTIDGVAFSGATSLHTAMQGKALRDVKEVTITGGRFQLSDWLFLLEKGQHGLAIETFTIESSVDKMVDMPDLPSSGSRFLPDAKIVSIAKLKKVGDYAFYDNYTIFGRLRSVSLPAVTEIGERAFASCIVLESVSLPAATVIGSEAFKNCRKLTHVSLPAATRVGESAFWDCQRLTSVSLPEAKIIGSEAFKYCSGLTHVSLPAATVIGSEAFKNCRKLTHVSLPAATKIGESAFWDCQRLTSVSLPEAKIIGSKAFKYCSGLTHASLLAATEIGESAFSNCTALTLLQLPVVTEIGASAFFACERLASLQLGPTPPSVGKSVFDLCPEIRTLIIINGDGVPLVGPALSTAANAYDGYAGAPIDGKWQKFAIEKNPPTLLLVKIVPAGAGTVKITRKKDRATVNQGDVLTKGDVLEVQAEHVNGYWPKSISAEGAKKIGDKEWEVTAEFSQPVIFTLEFEKVATLGATIKTPADKGELTIKRKEDGAVVNQGDALKAGEVLVVEGKPKKKYWVKSITAAGAKKIGEGNEWEVIAKADEQVVFTVEFEKLATLGATTIKPIYCGSLSITRKDGGVIVNQGDTLNYKEVLVVEGKPEVGYRVKSITAEGAKKIGDKEWEVTAMTGKVTFTVEFEWGQEGEGNNNNNNDPTPVESVLLAQARLFPNPTGGQVTVDAGSAVARCEVYSSTGALLQNIEAPESVSTIDLTTSPSGVYLVRLVDMNGDCKTLRVVKQ